MGMDVHTETLNDLDVWGSETAPAGSLFVCPMTGIDCSAWSLQDGCMAGDCESVKQSQI